MSSVHQLLGGLGDESELALMAAERVPAYRDFCRCKAVGSNDKGQGWLAGLTTIGVAVDLTLRAMYGCSLRGSTTPAGDSYLKSLDKMLRTREEALWSWTLLGLRLRPSTVLLLPLCGAARLA